jgi:hypothetical protein
MIRVRDSMATLAEAGSPSKDALEDMVRVLNKLKEHQAVFLVLGLPLLLLYLLIAARVILARYYIFTLSMMIIQLIVLSFVLSNYAYLLRKLFDSSTERAESSRPSKSGQINAATITTIHAATLSSDA